MSKFIKLVDQIFAVDEIAYVGASLGVQWEVHIILKCTPSSAFLIKEFDTENQAQEYVCAIHNVLIE